MREDKVLTSLVVITMKLAPEVVVEFKITEDPTCQQALNFYDIQAQLSSQLADLKVKYNKE